MSTGSVTAVSTVAAPPTFSINSDWGGANAESYISYADADTFLTRGVVALSAWTDASTTARAASLLEATRDIDTRQYIGDRYYSGQALCFPRALPGPYSRTQTGVSSIGPLGVDQERMKSRVEAATCHQAMWILRNNGQNIHMEHIAAGIGKYSERAGDTAESFEYRGGLDRLCHESLGLLRPYIQGRRVYRG